VLVVVGTAPADESEIQWGPFAGAVVDDGTSQPVPGAVCVAIWTEDRFRLGDTHSAFRDVRVAVADAHGHFAIPQQDRPLLFPKLVNPVLLECVAPGYAPHSSGGKPEPMLVRLRRLTPEQEKRLGGYAPNIGMIPIEQCRALEMTINAERNHLGLSPMDFCGGGRAARD